MHIHNTIERIREDKKITFGLAGGAAVLLVTCLWLISQSAEDLYEGLASVAAGEQPISNEFYDEQVVIAGELRRARQGLTADLKAGGIEDAGDTFEPLLLQATSYLQSTESVEQWLTAELEQISVPREEWVVESLDNGSQHIVAGDQCFTASKRGLRWKLASIGVCDG